MDIATSVAALARPSEILVSRTVKDLLTGSGIAFAARGSHQLAGAAGRWLLFAVAPAGLSPYLRYWMFVISSCRMSDGLAQPCAGSWDQISTSRSVTTIAMTALPLSSPSVRRAFAATERGCAEPAYRLRGRPMVAL